MKRNLGLRSWTMFLLGAFVLGSCVEDEIIENKHNLTTSETISFDAVVEWPKDNMDSRSATSSLKRKGNQMLQSDDDCEPVPMGIYVQDGIYPVGKEEVSSRGAVITKGDLNSFNVWATLNKAQSVGGGSIEYIAGQEFTNTDGVFSSNGTKYYWPGEGPTIDFLAVGNANDAFVPTMTGANGTFTYTVPTAATAQNDIVVAKAASIPGNNNASVPLDFQHIMSAVNVKVGSEMTAGTINSITFKNIKGKGTYDVASGAWTNVGTPTDYTVTFADGSNVVTESTAEGTLINGSNATFMMLPQTLEDVSETDKVEIIVNFTYTTSGQTKDLYAFLAGQTWAMGNTTNYLINVSPDFTLSIEEESVDIADCHYDMRVITVKNEHNNVDWVLSSDVNWVKFRMLPDDFETYEYKDYWVENHTVTVIERYIDTTVDNFKPEDQPSTTSYPLLSELNGNGTSKVLVYFYENVSDDDREANVSIKDINGKTLDQISLQQYAPLWNNGIAYERIEEDKASFPWGFASTRTVVYSYPNIEDVDWSAYDLQWLWELIVWAKDIPVLRLIARPVYNNFLGNRLNARGELYQQFYSSYINGQTNGFATISPSGGNGTADWGKNNAWSVTLNYGKLNSINATSESGLTNTITIRNYTGGSTGNDAETWLNNQNMVMGKETNTNDATTLSQTAVYQAIKKNSWVSSTITINTTSRIQDPKTKEYYNIYEPGKPVNDIVLSSSGIQWFLPSNTEIETLKSTACDTDNTNNDEVLSDTYWTSTSEIGTKAYMYSADGTSSAVSREATTKHKIRAARMKPTTSN